MDMKLGDQWQWVRIVVLGLVCVGSGPIFGCTDEHNKRVMG